MKGSSLTGLLMLALLFWAMPSSAFAAATAVVSNSHSLDTLVNARVAKGESLQALVLIHQELKSTAAGNADNLLALAHKLFQNQLDDSQLAEAAFMFHGSPLGQDACLQQAWRSAARGNRSAALRLVENVLQTDTPFPYRPEAVRLWEQLTGQSWLQRALGVLLPFSGRFAAFGELVRRGMELALEMHQEQGRTPVRFLYRDTGADPVLARRAVIELAEGERVMAIAGPLTGADAQAAATQAQESGIPLLTLSQKEGLSETGDYIFRDSLTSRQQVTALVRYAMEERGLTTFAILSPENRLGREMADLFSRAVTSRGGQVEVTQSYNENATDFRRQIRLLQRENPDAPEREQSRPIRPLPFEALFIPDHADRVALIAPQLVYYGIEQILLLGSNGWNSPDLIRLAGRSVEGAVFVDGFYRHSPYPVVQEFVDRYLERYGEEPSILEAQGYDAAGILLSILGNTNIRTRQDLRLALAHIRKYPGVTGATAFTAQGEAEKPLFLLQVQNGAIAQIN